MCVVLFPAASLYTSFHGLEDDVRLQYSFQKHIFSLLIVASYLVFRLNRQFCAVFSRLHVSLFSDTSFSARLSFSSSQSVPLSTRALIYWLLFSSLSVVRTICRRLPLTLPGILRLIFQFRFLRWSFRLMLHPDHPIHHLCLSC